jgi:RND superfamily putative drug exporter
MELLGDANWWMPRWLDRVLPKVHIEGDAAVEAELARLVAADELERVELEGERA